MKTPREKAEEIIDKHYWLFGDGYLGHQHIQHALIVVDELIKLYEYENPSRGFKVSYWDEVEIEIKKLS